MCEHEFIQEEWIVEVCKKCGKLQQEIDLEQQLASANARAEELEKEINNYLSFGQGGASFSDSQWLDKLATIEQHAEQAEKNFEDAKDKIAMMGAEIVRLSEGKEQAEAQCAAMQTAINRYVIGNIELLDAMKAALEDKP